MSNFHIGDIVEITNDSGYSVTKKGSYGTIVYISFDSTHVKIDFTSINRSHVNNPRNIFTISTDNIKLKQPNKPIAEQVLNKIKEMEERRKPTTKKKTNKKEITYTSIYL